MEQVIRETDNTVIIDMVPAKVTRETSESEDEETDTAELEDNSVQQNVGVAQGLFIVHHAIITSVANVSLHK